MRGSTRLGRIKEAHGGAHKEQISIQPRVSPVTEGHRMHKGEAQRKGKIFLQLRLSLYFRHKAYCTSLFREETGKSYHPIRVPPLSPTILPQFSNSTTIIYFASYNWCLNYTVQPPSLGHRSTEKVLRKLRETKGNLGPEEPKKQAEMHVQSIYRPGSIWGTVQANLVRACSY